MTTLPESKMSTTRYTMWYWYDQSCAFKTEDPNFSLNQLSKLVNAVQKEVNDETLVLPSQGPARPRQMEVAVFFPTSDADQGRFSRETGTELINRKARELKLPCSDFVSQSVENVRSFTRQEIERVFSFAKLPPNLIKEASEKIPSGQSHSEPCKRDGSKAQGVPLDAQTKTSWVTLILVAAGLVYIAKSAASIGAVYESGSAIVALICIGVNYGALTAGSIMTLIAPWVAGALLLIGSAVLLLKDAVNVMFVANDTDDAVSASAEDIANGERTKKTAYMPPATHAVTRGKDVVHDDNDMISVGVEGGQFSVGMDCPNSFFGGTNSVRVVPWYDPSGVAKRAMDSHTQSEELSVSPWKVSVHRSDNGPINWVFCHAGPTTYFR
ncbi:hypothetical protein CNMCM8812_006139 [Aspergillus fumigatus]|nr:hypothetical protein CNMCM8812_006139 [Aspergillus fumigatus]KAH1306120.1 hypothetical protein KXX11_008518 [Aspergillus fumigatus]KAH1457066.1 hypothetical protein KXX13_009379 [Aspergillus fumigatus]KAH1619701.1 hypothetical protein KXX21_008398 [Aspergillus fumigatus]KAH1921711.1 hypothetical protein KXW69_002742 [Aspergillus fumigatus]